VLQNNKIATKNATKKTDFFHAKYETLATGLNSVISSIPKKPRWSNHLATLQQSQIQARLLRSLMDILWLNSVWVRLHSWTSRILLLVNVVQDYDWHHMMLVSCSTKKKHLDKTPRLSSKDLGFCIGLESGFPAATRSQDKLGSDESNHRGDEIRKGLIWSTTSTWSFASPLVQEKHNIKCLYEVCKSEDSVGKVTVIFFFFQTQEHQISQVIGVSYLIGRALSTFMDSDFSVQT